MRMPSAGWRLVDAELGRLRQQVSLVREQALLATDENSIAHSLDALSASLNEANRWLKDQRELFAGIDNFTDEPPPADLLASKRAQKRASEGSRRVKENHTCSLAFPAAPPPATSSPLLLLLGIVGLGAVAVARARRASRRSARRSAGHELGHAQQRRPPPASRSPTATRPSPIEPVTGTPTLEAANTYVPKDKIDSHRHQRIRRLRRADRREWRTRRRIRESFFAKEYGFKVQISMSESETWSPAQQRPARGHCHHHGCAGRARPAVRRGGAGADRLLARRGHGRGRSRHPSVNALRGKVLAASQFNESEFFIRYLAQEAGVPVVVLRDLDSKRAGGFARPGVLRRCVRRLRRLST